MKAFRITLILGAVLVSANPAFSQFVKAALGFRLGHSPTERGYGQKPTFILDNKKAVGLQLLSGVNDQAQGQQAAGSGYGVVSGAPSHGAPSHGAHVGHNGVRHFNILGLNLYLGGRAAHHLPQIAHGHGVQAAPQVGWKAPLAAAPVKKPFSLFPLAAPLKPLLHLPSLGFRLKSSLTPHATPHSVGGTAGIRGSVGTPGWGVGFNVGYRQGVNTKSPLGLAFGLGGYPKYHHSAPRGYAPVGWTGYRAHGGHDNSIAHAPVVGAQNALLVETPIITGLESKQHMIAQPMSVQEQTQTAASTQQETHQAQASMLHPQPVQVQPPQHQGLQGPFHQPISRPSIFNLFGLASHNRPSILRPSPLHYTFQNPRPVASNPVQLVVQQPSVSASPHPPTPAPQVAKSPANEVPPQTVGWSTLYSINGQSPQVAASNVQTAFVNPVPANGQSLAKLQASLNPVAAAQNQFPYYQQAPQYQYQGFQGPRGGPGPYGRSIRPRSPLQAAAPMFAQGFSSLFRGPQYNYRQPVQQSLIPQQSHFLGQAAAPVQQYAPQGQPPQGNFPQLPQIPFTPDSVQFSPEPGFQYSHTTSFQPVNMGSYTMDLNMGSHSGEQSGAAAADAPMYGPGGRRIKKLKRARQDIIIKKQDNTQDMMEASASNNAITMASSLGATQWTPLVFVDIPRISRKSVEPTAKTPEIIPVVAASQPIITAVVPEEHNQDRSMILKNRRLRTSDEVSVAPTVIPSSSTISTSSTTSSTTTTTTSTVPPPPSTSATPPVAESAAPPAPTTVSA